MFRTAAAFAVAGLVALTGLKIVFGIFGGVLGLLFALAGLTLKLVCIGGAFYLALNIVSPSAARRLRERLGIEQPS